MSIRQRQHVYFTLYGYSVHIRLLVKDDVTYLAFCHDTLLAHGGRHIESALGYQTLFDTHIPRERGYWTFLKHGLMVVGGQC